MTPKLTDTPINRRHLLTHAGAALTSAAIGGAMNAGIISPALAKAPFLGAARPAFYRFKLGEFEITCVSDGEAMIDKVHPIFGANASEKEVIALLEDNLVPPKIFNPGFTPTIINTGDKVILFDTGNGDDGFAQRPHGGNLITQLGAAGFKPEQIDIVVITHCHSDHIGGIKEKDEEVFKNASYVISDIEFDFWNNKDKLPKGLEGFSKVFDTNTAGLKQKFRMIKPGDDVVTGIKAVKAYGHTPGHLAFHVQSKGNQLMVLGDCAHHHVVSFARPEWHMVFDVDKEAGVKTRKSVFDLCAKDKLPVIGFHMPFPAIGYVEPRKTGGYRWVPHSYQLK